MAITPPNFQKDAIPTPQGWRHPRTNELLVSRKITADEINEYFGAAPTPPVQVLTEAPTNLEEATNELIDSLPSDVEPPVDDDDEELESKTKLELEAIGREHGIELDRREKKSTLIDRLKGIIG